MENVPIFDVHTHAFPDKVAVVAIPKLEAAGVWFSPKATFDGTVSGLLGSMDRAGIRRAIVCSVATRAEQTTKITDWSVAIASERIVPFASVHPDYPDIEAEVERIARAGLKGLKYHPHYGGYPLDDPHVVRIARAAAAAGLAMLFHTGHDLAFAKDDSATPLRVRRLHEAVPDLRMTAAHLGGWELWPEVLELVAGLPVYLETSFTLGRCPPDLLARIFAKHPPGYLLFGTDAPWRDQREDVERFMALPLGEDLKRRILWDNALKFAGMSR
ncbi:MAG: amidohydrolase family protein [Planctomycetota bacterium]|nr:amidohydrolase family protein [Planctomycetota bacterium]